jgi:hypothetical protein
MDDIRDFIIEAAGFSFVIESHRLGDARPDPVPHESSQAGDHDAPLAPGRGNIVGGCARSVDTLRRDDTSSDLT